MTQEDIDKAFTAAHGIVWPMFLNKLNMVDKDGCKYTLQEAFAYHFISSLCNHKDVDLFISMREV